MRRAFVTCLLAIFFVAVVIAGLVAVEYVFSGGQAFDNLQILILRLQLNQRVDELSAPFRADTNKIRFQIAPGTGAGTIAAGSAVRRLDRRYTALPGFRPRRKS